MKTDSIFYRIFQQYPRSFFDLLNCPPSDAENYQFSSVEVKQLSFRLDGIFLPTDDTAERPFYLVEVQFQPDDSLYFRIFAELFVYLRQYQPPHPWRVAVIYPTRNIEREHPHQFRELLASNRVFRLYLDELDTCEDRLGVEIVKLVVVSEDRAIEAARRLLTKTQQTLPTSSLQRELLDLIETIVIYKLPQLSREEIATMLGLDDLKQTRFYQEAFEDGVRQGIEQGIEDGTRRTQRESVQNLAEAGIEAEEVSRLLKLPLEFVREVLNDSGSS